MVNLGIANLKVALRAGRSVVVEQYSQAPLQLHRPLYLGESSTPTVYLRTPSSGFLDGDEHRLSVTIDEGGALELRTQAAALVYPGTSRQTISIDIADGGELRFRPHPLILAKGADFTQTVSVNLASGARLFFTDTFAAGRVAMGEKWMFERFSNKVEIRVAGALVYFDQSVIAPLAHVVDSAVIMERYTIFSTAYCFGEWADRPLGFAAGAEPACSSADGKRWRLQRGANVICRAAGIDLDAVQWLGRENAASLKS